MSGIATSWVRDLDTTVDAGASLTILSDRSVAMSSAAARSYVSKRVPARPGSVITIRYKVSVTGGECGVSIDYPAAATSMVLKRHSVSELEEHTLTVSIPDTALDTNYVQVALGNFTGYTSDCVFQDITISVDEPHHISPRVHGCGVIIINNPTPGSVSVSSDFAFSGIDKSHLMAQTVTTTLLVKLPVCTAQARSAPLIFAQQHGFNNVYDVEVFVGAYDRVTGIATVRFVDATTHALKDISSLGAFYLSFTALGY